MKRIVSSKGWAALLGGLAVLALGGCSASDVGYVSGKVTLNGQPPGQASIVFEDAAKGVSVNAPLADDGTYTVRTYNLDGLPPGTYQVAVTPKTFGDGEIPLAADPAAQAAPPSAIPEKYRTVATSGLTATVKAGKNPPFDFDLK